MAIPRVPKMRTRPRRALQLLNQLTGLDPGPAKGDFPHAVISPGSAVVQVLATTLLVHVEELSGAGSWTAPTGVTTVTVKARGAGAGGGQNTLNAGGGGGGGGAYSQGNVVVVPGTSYAFDCGAGGEPAEGGNIAGDGGNATFNATSIVAVGGDAGASATGGLGGLAADCTGTITRDGGDGGDSTGGLGGGGGGGGADESAAGNDGTDSADEIGGAGGTAVDDTGAGGLGGTSGVNGGDGQDGLPPGGGGGGAQMDAADTRPGRGADGGITLEYTAAGVFVTDWVALSLIGVVSVTNVDGSLTISPTTGAVIASLNTAHANLWTAQQTFTKLTLTLTTNDTFAFTLTTATP